MRARSASASGLRTCSLANWAAFEAWVVKNPQPLDSAATGSRVMSSRFREEEELGAGLGAEPKPEYFPPREGARSVERVELALCRREK